MSSLSGPARNSPVDATWALLQHECQELEEFRLFAREKGRHNNRVPTRVGARVIELMGLDRVAEADRAAVGTVLAEKSRQPPYPTDRARPAVLLRPRAPSLYRSPRAPSRAACTGR